jgi:hypothetical protein
LDERYANEQNARAQSELNKEGGSSVATIMKVLQVLAAFISDDAPIGEAQDHYQDEQCQSGQIEHYQSRHWSQRPGACAVRRREAYNYLCGENDWRQDQRHENAPSSEL